MGRRLCFLLMVLVIVNLCSAQKDRKPSTGGSGSGDSGSGGSGTGGSGSGDSGTGGSGSGGSGSGDSGTGGSGGSGTTTTTRPAPTRPGRPEVPMLRPRQQAICGDDTPFVLKGRMRMAFQKAKKYVLEHKNEMWGWGKPYGSESRDPFSQFEDTASAIMSLQLATEGEWYGKSAKDLGTHLSVKQLEVENLAYLSHFLADLHMKRNNESYEGNMTRDHMMNGTRPGHNMTRGDGNMTRPGYNMTDLVPGMMNDSRMMNGSMQHDMMALNKLTNNMLALSLTCHSPTDFFGHDLFKLLQYTIKMMMEKEKMHMDRNQTSAEKPTAPPNATHSPNATSEHICDMLIPKGPMRSFNYGMGLLLLCRNGSDINETMISCMNRAHLKDELYKENGVGDANVFLLAMSCIKPKVHGEQKQNFSRVMTKIANYIMEKQETSGAFGNPVRTAFALQALKSAEIDPSKFECTAVVRNLLKNQNADGSFGDSLGATVAILPTLAHKSLADLKHVEPDCGRMSHGGDGHSDGGMGDGHSDGGDGHSDGGRGDGRPAKQRRGY